VISVQDTFLRWILFPVEDTIHCADSVPCLKICSYAGQLSLDRTLFPVQDTVPCTGYCSPYRTQFRVQYSTLFPVLDTVPRRGYQFTDTVLCARFCYLCRIFFPIQDIVSVQDTVYSTGLRCLHKTLFLHWTLFPEEDPTRNTDTVPCIGPSSL
jgi:hypothetical protein